MPNATTITIILVLSVLVEMLVEYFLKPLVPQPKDDANPPWWATIPWARYAAALVGIGICLWYGLDILSIMFPTMAASYVGMILTGLLISRGANYLHDWIANPVLERLLK
jgi:hypothetical protein